MTPEFEKLVERATKGDVLSAYLLVGSAEQPLRDAAHRLADAIVPESERSFNLVRYDGAVTRAAEVADDLCSLSLLGGRRVVVVLGATFLASKQDRKALVMDLVERWEQGREEQSLERAVTLLSEAGVALSDLAGRSKKAAEGFGKKLGMDVAKDDRVDAWRQWLGARLDETGRELPPPSGGVALLEAMLEDGRAEGNTLIVTARKVERTLGAVKAIRKHGAVLTLDAAPGRASDQIVAATVDRLAAETGLALDPAAREALLARLIPDPERIAREMEKLSIHAGGAASVSVDDVEALVGKDREDPIWELQGALGSRDLHDTLRRVGALLERARDPSGETIRLSAALSSEVRRLLRARALIDGPLRGRMGPRTTSRNFESEIFPMLAELDGAAPLASGHPFRAYRTFQGAGRWRLEELVRFLRSLARLDRDLKSRPTDARLLLERTLIGALRRAGSEARR